MPDTSANRIGDYELLEVIGEGAEGRVYKARCLRPGASDELVALKRLRWTGQNSEALLFKRQTEILRRLDHPNIVRYKDSFIWREDELDEEIFCLATELLEGQSIKVLLEQRPNGLPWPEASNILLQVLSALAYASTLRVVHRDLKPSNIYITRQGTVKIIDFGIAREVDSGATTTAASGNIKGSFDYMAPDFVRQGAQFRGDEQSDIFSFGVCFYQILTGKLPFPPLGVNPLIAYVSRWHSPQPPEPDFRHPVFSVLSLAAQCIRKCLTVDRRQRYQTFQEVLTDFQKIKPRTLRHGEEVYEYVEYLGKGGFGRVFRARRLRDGLETAIKEMLADRHAKRFIREARILQKARHPNLVQYLDFVEVQEERLGDQRRLFLVMEYLKGMPGAGLRERIRNSQAGLDARETLTLFAGYLDCLEHLHRLGIIHRDIKPGNLYAPEGEPAKAKIFDLGIAHDTEGTRTHGHVPGTLDYMPPEFATQTSNRGSPQSDIYALGVTLYQALTKRLPFPRLPEKEPDAWLAFYQRSQNPPECPFDHSVFLAHPELIPLIRRAIAPRPEQRYPSAAVMRTHILEILDTWNKKYAFEEAIAATRTALEQQNYDEAQHQAKLALSLMPGDPTALALQDQVQEHLRQKAYAEAVAAARAALAQADYPEATFQAQKALTLKPKDAEAIQLIERARKAAAEIPAGCMEHEPSTMATATYGTAPHDATAPTLPANLRHIVRLPECSEVHSPIHPPSSNLRTAEPPPPSKDAQPGQARHPQTARLGHTLFEAEQAAAAKDYAKAIRLCEALLQQCPEEPHARQLKDVTLLLQAAQAAADKRQWSEALRVLRQAQRNHPDNPLVQRELVFAEEEWIAERIRRATCRKQFAARLAAAAAALLLLAALSAGLLQGWNYATRRFEDAMRQAQSALAAGNLPLAEAAAQKALTYKPWSTAANHLLRQARYSLAMQAASNAWHQAWNAWHPATNALASSAYEDALRHYADALSHLAQATSHCHEALLHNPTPEATNLMAALTHLQDQVQRSQQEARTREDNYKQALDAAIQARSDASNAWRTATHTQALDQYDAALFAVSNALYHCQLALSYRSSPEATTLKSELVVLEQQLHQARHAAHTRQHNYLQALQAVTNAWNTARADWQLATAALAAYSYEQAIQHSADALGHLSNAISHSLTALFHKPMTEATNLLHILTAFHQEVDRARTDALRRHNAYVDAIQAATNAWTTAQDNWRKATNALGLYDYLEASRYCTDVLNRLRQALAHCEIALTNKPTPQATNLVTALLLFQRHVEAAQDTAQKRYSAYNTAIQSATNEWRLATQAIRQTNYAEARRFLRNSLPLYQEALQVRPTDSSVSNQTNLVMVLLQALEVFHQGDYQKAMALCQEHGSLEPFYILQMAILAESNSLATAQARFALGDYNWIDPLKQSFGHKPHFRTLIESAQQEHDLLKTCAAVKATNGWAVIQQLLFTQPPTVRSKQPFKELEEWTYRQKEKEVERLDQQLRELMGNFNIGVRGTFRPTGKRLPQIDDAGRQRYHAAVNKLANDYEAYGVLQQDGRAQVLKELRNAIDNWW